MATTVIVGAVGSGKSTALTERYLNWVRGGVRTEQVLVLAAGAAQVTAWRQRVALEAFGSLEVFSFFGFLQRELNLHWGAVQAQVAELRSWVQPAFLPSEVANELVRGLVEPYEAQFSDTLKAKPRRIAAQIAGGLSTVAAAAGLDPAAMAERMALAGRPDRAGLYDSVRAILEAHRAQCLRAGVLDYALSLELFTQVLVPQATYREHLRQRYRYLLVDDLDETVPAEQDFLEAVSRLVDEAVFAYGTDGGHRTFLGADPQGAWERFGAGRDGMVALPGSHTCVPRAFAFGDALARRIQGEAVAERFPGMVAEHMVLDLRSDLIGAVVRRLGELLDQGEAPGEIVVLAPTVERALEVTARRALAERGVAVWNLSPTRRILDEPHARALITLAGLVNPAWGILQAGAGALSALLQVLAGLDPVRAAELGEVTAQAGELPELPTPEGRHLRAWVEQARQRQRPWEPDEFVQTAMAEVLAPLTGSLSPELFSACQQLLGRASRFREAAERFGPGAFSSRYVRLLTDGTAVVPPSLPTAPAVVLATPYAYLSSGLSSRVQVWFDISSNGWYPADVKELTNPHILGRRWPAGEPWTDLQHSRTRQAGAARLVRALVRRCIGQIILGECNLSAWGQEQEGGLAEAFTDLAGPAPAPEGRWAP